MKEEAETIGTRFLCPGIPFFCSSCSSLASIQMCGGVAGAGWMDRGGF